MFYLWKYICGAYSKRYPYPIPGFLPSLGKTCIPEGYDEAFGACLPVLSPGGGGGSVLRAVAATPAGRLALPGCGHTSGSPEAGPWAHPRHSCLHPLRALLRSASPELAFRKVERKSQKDSASQASCAAVSHLSTKCSVSPEPDSKE